MENSDSSSTPPDTRIPLALEPLVTAAWPAVDCSDFKIVAAAPWKVELLPGDQLRLSHNQRIDVTLPNTLCNFRLLLQSVRLEQTPTSVSKHDSILLESALIASGFSVNHSNSEMKPFLEKLSSTISLKNALDALFRLKWFQHHSLGLLLVHQKGESRAWQIGIGEEGSAGTTHTIDVEMFNQLHTAVKKTKTGQFSTQTPRWGWLPFGGAFLAEAYGFKNFSAVLVASRQEFLPFASTEVTDFHHFAGLMGLWMEGLIEGEFSDLRMAEVMLLLERYPLPLILKDPAALPVFTNAAHNAETDSEKMSVIPLGKGYTLSLGFEVAREDAEIDVIHRHKISLLGDLFNTLGHELSNPLFGLGLAAEIVLMSTQDPESQVMLSEIGKNVKRCQLILQNLTRLYSDNEQEGHCDLRSTVKEALTLVKSEFKGIRQEAHGLQGPVLHIEGRPVLIVQILFNLLVNSSQAMRTFKNGVPLIKVSISEDETHAFVEIQDNGPGLPLSIRENLFKPFSTTRAKGHGLGLALSRNLALKAGGDLEFLDPPAGAAFRLSLRKSP